MINIRRYYQEVAEMDLKKWCANQAEEAKKYKWCKGVELGSDPGAQAVIDWVNEHAANYRKEYNQCLNNITNIVFLSIKVKIKDVEPEYLRQITDLVIEEFTKEWVKGEANDIKHNNEI